MTAFYKDNRMEPIANIGDLVSVKEQGMRIFEVIGFSHEYQIDAENVFEEIYYDLVCVTTAEFMLADQFSVNVVESAGGKPVDYLPKIERSEPRVEEEPTVDDLLDELRDALELRELFGDHEDDEKKDRKIALKVCEVKAKLKEATR